MSHNDLPSPQQVNIFEQNEMFMIKALPCDRNITMPNGLPSYTRDTFSCITKTCPCNVYPLKPHFYIVKLGYAGVHLFFLIFAPTHRLWVLVRTASARRF